MESHDPFDVALRYLYIGQRTRTTYNRIVSFTTIIHSKRAKHIASNKHHNTIVEPNISHVYK